MLLTLDVPEENVPEFRALCKRHRIDIVQFNPQGPAGGNPRFTVVTDMRETFLLVGDFYFGAVV